MGITDDVESTTRDIFDAAWQVRSGTVVPETTNITLKDGAVEIDATYLYADLADSSKLAQFATDRQTGKIIRGYLNAAVRIIKKYDGEIRSFDGDRVMGIFIGDSKNTNAMRTALGINWAVWKVLLPRIEREWPTLKTHWTMSHGVGIATGDAFIVRGGVRNSNDIVSIGSAPNVAAKLSEQRQNPNLYITSDVYSFGNNSVKDADDGNHMWSARSPITVGGKSFGVYGSTWWKRP